MVISFSPGYNLGIASSQHMRDYLPALTGLRFWLAVWVILHHISGKGMMLEPWTKSLPSAGQSLVWSGHRAVQTFFVLSGFVLARSYNRSRWERHDVVKYVAARFARIYPVYILSIAIVSPFIFDSMMRPARTPLVKAGLLLNYAFVLQGWTGNLGVGWNTPAWTLSCEFFFYLFFPLLFIWLRDAGKWTLAAVMLAAIALPTLLAHAGVPATWKPLHHMADFAAGIVTARLFDMMNVPALRRFGAWFYLPALVLGALLIIYPGVMDIANYRGWGGDVNTGLRPLNVLALIGLGLGSGTGARLLSTAWAEYLGKASYSMYILHVPVLWWYNKWAIQQGIMPLNVAAAVYMAIVIAVSAISFEVVEKPVNRWIRVGVSDWLKNRSFSHVQEHVAQAFGAPVGALNHQD
jgi:peptidoglycan/LPS O-acetylase OafA/YrhL